ncbi:MAG: zf-HC2 domain-containing protein [Planctomycetota bacterium]|nr:zf-HC2 domain-containing protein [Planctomycetota bacterium]
MSVQSIVPCAEAVEQVRPYLDGELPPSQAAAFLEHLHSCPGCKAEFDSRKEVFSLLGQTYSAKRISDSFDNLANKRLLTMRNTPTGPQAVPAGAKRIAIPVRQTEQEQADEPEAVAAPAPSLFDALNARLGAAPWWIVSGAFHALLLLLITLIGAALLRARSDEVVIVTDLQRQEEPPEEEKPRPRDVFKQPVEFESTEVTAETPIVTHEEVEIADHVETANEADLSETRGEDGMSDVFLGGTGTVAALGLGGGGGGAFGRPNGSGGRLRRAIQGGGGKATESAVDKALEWLARHQEPDGSWDSRKHECQDGLRAHAQSISNVGCTGFAILAFLGAGHTDRVGKYKQNVKMGLQWLIGELGEKNRWSDGHQSNYSHGVAALALAEAAAMCRSPEIKKAAQQAADGVTEGQIKDGESEYQAWDYQPKSRVNDTSVTGWNVMALKSAKIAGLRIEPASLEGALRWIHAAQDLKGAPAGGDAAYWEGGLVWYRGTLDQPGGHQNMALASIGALTRLFVAAEGPDSAGVAGPCNLMLKHLPAKYPSGYDAGDQNGNLYYWYYATLVAFQKGGDHWAQWNEAMKKTLLNAQRKDGDFDGSWDPQWPCFGGRVMTTALGAMCLEVYYRYLPLYR